MSYTRHAANSRDRRPGLSAEVITTTLSPVTPRPRNITLSEDHWKVVRHRRDEYCEHVIIRPTSATCHGGPADMLPGCDSKSPLRPFPAGLAKQGVQGRRPAAAALQGADIEPAWLSRPAPKAHWFKPEQARTRRRPAARSLSSSGVGSHVINLESAGELIDAGPACFGVRELLSSTSPAPTVSPMRLWRRRRAAFTRALVLRAAEIPDENELTCSARCKTARAMPSDSSSSSTCSAATTPSSAGARPGPDFAFVRYLGHRSSTAAAGAGQTLGARSGDGRLRCPRRVSMLQRLHGLCSSATEPRRARREA